ncbi:MAG: VWA domain-containing protein [Chloroflexi bacterium]|nr:VWA domain-containing protein [Chloroflexota bacterium]MBV9545565.1 VWA domain-containing protein [Chloroflexota bacterium]
MQLAHPEFLLLLAVLPVIYLVWRQQHLGGARAITSLAVRITMTVALVLALAGLTVAQPLDRQAVVFVADLSSSAQSAVPQQQQFIHDAAAAKRPDDAFAVVSTAKSAAVERILSTSADFSGLNQSLDGDGTDLAAGLRAANTLLPAGYRNRVVLLSDGQETSGDATAQARLLHARGIEVDVLPLAVNSGPEVLVDQVQAPQVVNEGERYSVRVNVASNVATEGTLRLSVQNNQIAEQQVSLQPGSNAFSFQIQAGTAGLSDVEASIQADQDTLTQNNQARAVVEVQGPPRVLVAEQRDGEGATIAAALTSAGMRVETHPATDLPETVEALGSYSAVVLADVSAETLTDGQQTTLRSFVRDLGRGLLAIGGDTSYGQGSYLGSALDDVLPVRSSVRSHRDQGRIALALVLDRSGSMSDDIYHEGTTKLEMAREAAILSADQLSPRDLVGVEAFDSQQHWILPLSSLLTIGPTAVRDKLAPLTADGGTDIYPAMASAYDAIVRADAQYKHIILLTDGMSCCGGDYTGVIDKMLAANITLSTIAVGGDADQQLLQQLARQGDGRYYFAEHARDIPRLMTRETQLATRGPLVEGDVAPRQVAPDPTVSALAAGGLPSLGGYLVTTPKDLAEVLLVSDAADPLLARWQYGLGRAVAWTSDLRGRWSANWLDWSGTPQLFSSMVSWTIPPAEGPLRLTVRTAADTAHVSVQETTPVSTGTDSVRALVAQPGGAPLEVALGATAPGQYEGDFPLSGAGTYIVRAEEHGPDGASASAETGVPVAYSAEYHQVAPDTRKMDQIARAGGGHVLSSPGAAFADDLPSVTSPLPLERWLLLLAALLLPLDVALRRLRISPSDVLRWLRHPSRLRVVLPGLHAEPLLQTPTWLPGMQSRRRRVAPRVTAPRGSPTVASAVTPGLARQSEADMSEEDALAATLRWLVERRGNAGDSH